MRLGAVGEEYTQGGMARRVASSSSCVSCVLVIQRQHYPEASCDMTCSSCRPMLPPPAGTRAPSLCRWRAPTPPTPTPTWRPSACSCGEHVPHWLPQQCLSWGASDRPAHACGMSRQPVRNPAGQPPYNNHQSLMPALTLAAVHLLSRPTGCLWLWLRSASTCPPSSSSSSSTR